MNEWDDALEARLREAVREYNAPPDEPPREAMWAAIRYARTGRRTDRLDRRGRRPWHGTWTARVVGLAAAVVIGIALGRMTALFGPAADPPAVAGGDASPTVVQPRDGETESRRAGPYRLAAAEHLGRAEALLVQFRTGAAGESVDAEVVDRARDLLLSTRLLLDSPAADDREMRALLEDLELVLAQIVHLPGRGQEERDFVEEGIEGRHVLLRLRAAVPSGPPVRAGA